MSLPSYSSKLICRLALAAVCLAAGGHHSVAHADNLDEALIRQAPKLMKYLRDKNYRNVGVLPFRLKKGSNKPNFHGGLITKNMAARVENALVLAMNPEYKPIGIVKDAGSVAARNLRSASYRNARDRNKLFRLHYPLAWGSAKVQPDAFLAGKVTIGSDLRETNITIEAFDRKDPNRFRQIFDFDVKTDRYMLADAGYGFSTSKGRRRFSRGPSDDDIIDDIIVEDESDIEVDDDDKDRASSDSDSSFSSGGSADFPVELTIRYDGVEQQLDPDSLSASPNNWEMDDPKEGQIVTFDLRNKTDEELGVVLTVNGISTLFEETQQPSEATRWVLAPNKTYRVKGYHSEDMENYTEIEGYPEDVSEEKFEDLGGEDVAGLIHLYVFRKTDDTDLNAPGFSRSMRRVSSKVLKRGRPQTAFDLQALVARSANAKGGRGLMAWGANEKQEDLSEKELGTVALTDTMIVRYYRPPGGGDPDSPDTEKEDN